MRSHKQDVAALRVGQGFVKSSLGPVRRIVGIIQGGWTVQWLDEVGPGQCSAEHLLRWAERRATPTECATLQAEGSESIGTTVTYSRLAVGVETALVEDLKVLRASRKPRTAAEVLVALNRWIDVRRQSGATDYEIGREFSAVYDAALSRWFKRWAEAHADLWRDA